MRELLDRAGLGSPAIEVVMPVAVVIDRAVGEDERLPVRHPARRRDAAFERHSERVQRLPRQRFGAHRRDVFRIALQDLLDALVQLLLFLRWRLGGEDHELGLVLAIAEHDRDLLAVGRDRRIA